MGVEKQFLLTVFHMGQCSKTHLKPRVLGIIFWNLSPVTGVLDLEKLVFGVKKKKKKKEI